MAQNTFFQELKRRNVFKVASIYAVTAWLIIQVAAVAFPAFELPIWTWLLWKKKAPILQKVKS